MFPNYGWLVKIDKSLYNNYKGLLNIFSHYTYKYDEGNYKVFSLTGCVTAKTTLEAMTAIGCDNSIIRISDKMENFNQIILIDNRGTYNENKFNT